MTATESPSQSPEGSPPSDGPRWPSFGAIVVGFLLVAIGMVWLLDVVGVIEVRPTVILPIALLVVGLALMVGAWSGEHGGLIAIGVILTILVLASAASPLDAFRGGVGERQETPLRISEAAQEYRLGAGTLTVDLAATRFEQSVTEVEAAVGFGELVVIVPRGLALQVDANAGAGQVLVFGQAESGLGVDQSFTTPGFDSAERRVVLDLDVFMGEIEVRR